MTKPKANGTHRAQGPPARWHKGRRGDNAEHLQRGIFQPETPPAGRFRSSQRGPAPASPGWKPALHSVAVIRQQVSWPSQAFSSLSASFGHDALWLRGGPSPLRPAPSTCESATAGEPRGGKSRRAGQGLRFPKVRTRRGGRSPRSEWSHRRGDTHAAAAGLLAGRGAGRPGARAAAPTSRCALSSRVCAQPRGAHVAAAPDAALGCGPRELCPRGGRAVCP